MRQVNNLKKKEADFSIACPQCYKVKLNGAQIRCINNAHRVIIGHDIDSEVIKMPGRTILEKDDWEMYGFVICKCKKRLGQMLLYKKVRSTRVNIGVVYIAQWLEHQNSNLKNLSSIPWWGRVTTGVFFYPSESTLVQTCLCLTPLHVYGTHPNLCAC